MSGKIELERLRALNRALAAEKAQLEKERARFEKQAAELRAKHIYAEQEAARLRVANAQVERQTSELRAEHLRVVTLKDDLEAQLTAALLELAELKRQLFGEKTEKLTPEEESQLAEVAADLQARLRQSFDIVSLRRKSE